MTFSYMVAITGGPGPHTQASASDPALPKDGPIVHWTDERMITILARFTAHKVHIVEYNSSLYAVYSPLQFIV